MHKITLETVKQVVPMIYCYTTPEIRRHDGWVKIGYTEQDVKERLKQQSHTIDVEIKEEWRGNAIFEDGSGERFTDKDFHAYLRKQEIENDRKNEWFHIAPEPAELKFYKFRKDRGILSSLGGVVPYTLRAEQAEAVSKTAEYFNSHENGEYLWNAKPRFGKTLSVYDFCKTIKAQNVLIVTNRPAIANSWYSDYEHFLGTESGYRFVSSTESLKGKPLCISRNEYITELISAGDNPYNCIEFVSLQDLKGSVYFGGEYDKLREIADIEWDVLVIDEAHEGVDTYKTDVAFDHSIIDELQSEPKTKTEEEKNIEKLNETFTSKLVTPIVEAAKANYGSDLKASDKSRLERKLKDEAERTVGKIYGNYQIENKQLDIDKKAELEAAYTQEEKQDVIDRFKEKQAEIAENFARTLVETAHSFTQKAGEETVRTIETSKKEQEKKSIESGIKDHLRGFSRTIPSFLMAYGDDNLTLATFDKVIPDNVFLEVTSITLEQFRFLRDGGDYTEEETGETKHFDGNLFEPVVFNDSVKEFLHKKEILADYFEESSTEDIFDYIPPQKTNQIFTPKWVVKKMVDMLEEGSPCKAEKA